MKLKEFIIEAAVDDLSAEYDTQQQTKAQTKAATPYNQSKLGNFIGGTAQPTSMVGKALNTLNPTNVISKLGGVAGGLNNALQAGKNAGLSGVSVAYKGSPADISRDPADQKAAAQPVAPAGGQPIAYVQGKVDTHVAQYLTKAAANQPLKQATGNTNIDSILKAAGLLK